MSEDKYWLEDHEKRLDLDFKTIKARGLSSAATDRDGVFKGLVFFRHESFPMKMEETKTVVECAGGTMTRALPPMLVAACCLSAAGDNKTLLVDGPEIDSACACQGP